MPRQPLKYYQEPNGDYLCVAPSEEGQAFDEHTARATNIEGMPESLTTCTVVDGYLNDCVEVPLDSVPTDWQQWMYLY